LHDCWWRNMKHWRMVGCPKACLFYHIDSFPSFWMLWQIIPWKRKSFSILGVKESKSFFDTRCDMCPLAFNTSAMCHDILIDLELTSVFNKMIILNFPNLYKLPLYTSLFPTISFLLVLLLLLTFISSSKYFFFT